MALSGYADKILGQGEGEGVIRLVITQDKDNQTPNHKALKRQQVISQKAAQGTGKAAYHPAYWGGDGKGGGSWWDNDTQDRSSEGKEDDPQAPKTRLKNLPIINRALKVCQKTGGVDPTRCRREGMGHQGQTR